MMSAFLPRSKSRGFREYEEFLFIFLTRKTFCIIHFLLLCWRCIAHFLTNILHQIFLRCYSLDLLLLNTVLHGLSTYYMYVTQSSRPRETKILRKILKVSPMLAKSSRKTINSHSRIDAKQLTLSHNKISSLMATRRLHVFFLRRLKKKRRVFVELGQGFQVSRCARDVLDGFCNGCRGIRSWKRKRLEY